MIEKDLVSIVMRIESEANMNDHWVKKRRRAIATKLKIRAELSQIKKKDLPINIIFTRIAPRPLDIDNLWAAMKTPIDVVADWITPGLRPGMADSKKGLRVSVEQRKGKPKQYLLEIEFFPQGEDKHHSVTSNENNAS